MIEQRMPLIYHFLLLDINSSRTNGDISSDNGISSSKRSVESRVETYANTFCGDIMRLIVENNLYVINSYEPASVCSTRAAKK